jgi:hypothetical protein
MRTSALTAFRNKIVLETAKLMTIHYTNGKSVEALLLAQTGNTLRVATPGEDDALEFTRINGLWVSDDCEPARIEFAWQRKKHQPEVTEADCICPHELAAHLIHLLWNGDDVGTGLLACPRAEGAYLPEVV